MIIDKLTTSSDLRKDWLNIYPNQFLTDKEKREPVYVKQTMDYFANVAFAQYRKNKQTFVKNYELMAGIIDRSHFEDVPQEIRSFTDTLLSENTLPSYVKHYPILNPPVNTMVGELSKRPDGHKVRAFDDDSKDEEFQYKTGLMEQLILQEARAMIMQEMVMKGQDISQMPPEEMEQLTLEKVQEYMTSFTTQVEKWGNHVLTALKVQMNTKEKSEDAFRDLLIASRQYYHIFEDNSKTGFNSEVANPKNVWRMGTPDAKYTSAVSGEQNVPYAAGLVHVMEISEILEKFTWLTKKEIDHLTEVTQQEGLPGARESNLTSGKTGPNSIIYDTYYRLEEQDRMMLEMEVQDGSAWSDDIGKWLGRTNTESYVGSKFTVVRSYHISKKKIALLTYMDENGEEQSTLVDETYIEGTPGEINVEWGWINQWYMGTRIGNEIYHLEPFELLDYCPIIGVVHNSKNTPAKSLVDLMLPYQVLFNICMNQLWELLEKEKGVLQVMSLRHIPTVKDGDAQDSIEIWEQEAKNRGVMFVDDSPENTKGASSFNQYSRLDLSRTAEIQSRYQLAAQLKAECWELIGMNRQRLGAAQATETATANQNNLVASFSQTEPFFAAHDYVLNQYYQGLLDAAQYVESRKPESTISYITNMGEQAAMTVAGDDLKMRDMKVFVTGRAEDQELLREFRQLSQAMLQNGASVYDVSVLYSTNSLRHMQKIFKDLQKKQEEMQAQQGELQQSQMQQDAAIAQAQMEMTDRHHTEDLQMDKYKTDVAANTKIASEQIKTYFQQPNTDNDGDGNPDIIEIAAHAQKAQELLTKVDLENRKMAMDMQKMINENINKAEDRKVTRENMKNDLAIENKKLDAARAKKPAAKKK